MSQITSLAVWITGLIAFGILLLVVYLFFRLRYKKAGPDEALIVFGRRKLLGVKVRDEKGEVAHQDQRITAFGPTPLLFRWPPGCC